MRVNQSLRFPQQPHPEFFATLNQRVRQRLSDLGTTKHGDYRLFLKTFLLYSLYLGSYGLVVWAGLPGWAMLLLCVAMGVGAAGLGMNVMHDAHHDSYSSNKTLNRVLAYTMEVLGGNSVNWKIQHNVLHHTYTNVYGHDEDIADKTMLRLSPDGIWKKHHRYQHVYAFVLYGLSTLSWVFNKDFGQFKGYNEKGMVRQIGANPILEYRKLWVSKVLYLIVMLVIPLLVMPVAWYWVVLGFVLMHFVTGLIMTCVFLTAHAVEDTHHFQPDEAGGLANNWAIHQLETTANFRCSKLLSWYVGGLNYQIEHHLFSNISHVHYPQLAPIVRATAAEFGIPYTVYRSFWSALGSHFKYLREVGRKPVGQLAVAVGS